MSQIIYSDPALEQIICSALAQHTLSYNLHHRLAMCHTATDRPPINAEFERHISSEVAQQVRKSFAKVDLETVQIIVNTLRLDSVTRAILQRGDIDPGVLGVAYNRASKGGGISDVGLLARALYAPVLDTVRNAVTRYIDTYGPLRTGISVPILAETATTSTSIIHSALSSTFHPREPSGESRSLTEYVSLLLPFVHTLELSEIVKNELVFIDSFSRKLVDDKWPTYVASGEMNLSSLLAQEIMFSGHGASPQFLHTMRQVLVAPEIIGAIEYLVPSINPGTLPAMFYDTLRHDASPTATQLALDIYRPLIERLRNFLLEDFPAPGPGKLSSCS